MRHLAAALVALSACTGPVTGTDADDPGIDDPPITFPSTDMGTDMARTADMARDAWVCVQAASEADGKPCGCPGLPCCQEGELAKARSGWGGDPQCYGVTQPPGGHNEMCQRYGSAGYYRYVCELCGHLNEACCDPSSPVCYDGSACNGSRCVPR